ncbi:hypothetical protein FACS1894108_13910 [Planctomycetales bacterium]|nr:hypothetical protein FACS1894108_13910 [Planctomycetales bacterium]
MGITCNLELSALKFAVKDLRLVDGKLNLTLTADLTPAQIVATFTPPSAGQAAEMTPSASREWQRKPYFPVVAETSTPPETSTAAPEPPEWSAAPQPENAPAVSEPAAPVRGETSVVAPSGAALPSMVDENPLPPVSELPAIIDESEPVGGDNQPETVASEEATIDEEPLISDDNEAAETPPVEIPAAEEQPEESPLPTPEVAIDEEPLISDDNEAAETPPASPVSETVAAPEAPVSRYGEPQADDEFALALTNAHAAPQVAPAEDARDVADEEPRRDEIETPPATAVQPPEPAIADSSLDVLASAPTTAFSYDLAAEIPPVSKPELALAPETPVVEPIEEVAPRPATAPSSSEFSYDLRPEESTPSMGEPAPPTPPTPIIAAPSTADYEPQPLTPPPSVLHPNGIARSAPPEAPAPAAPSAPAAALAANKPMRVRYVCPRCQTPGVQDADKIKNIITCKNCGRAMRLTIKN